MSLDISRAINFSMSSMYYCDFVGVVSILNLGGIFVHHSRPGKVHRSVPAGLWEACSSGGRLGREALGRLTAGVAVGGRRRVGARRVLCPGQSGRSRKRSSALEGVAEWARGRGGSGRAR